MPVRRSRNTDRQQLLDDDGPIGLYGTLIFMAGAPSVVRRVGAQFAQLSRSEIFSTVIGTRHSLTAQRRFAPTVRYTHSDKSDNSVDWSVIPEVQIDYRWKRNIQFQLEGGENLSRLGQVG